MIIPARRTSLALSAGFAGFAGLVLALAPVAAQASPGPHTVADHITLDPSARVTEDGAVTVGGTYLCSPDHRGSVLLGANLRQGTWHVSVGGTLATCDGREHTWRTTERIRYEVGPGTLQADATMLELDFSYGLVPRTTVLATDAHDIVVERT
jgi:uncharacterized protein DUF6299